MKIGIYDPYLDDLGGGEKYMMTIAEYLSRHHSVDVFWNNKEDVKKVQNRFCLNLDGIKVVNNIFSPKVSFIQRILKTSGYDIIIVLSDGSLPVCLAKKTLIHFQQPLPNVSPSLKNKLKTIFISNFFCNSNFTKSFIDKEFGIDSKALYPPVEIKAEKLKKENIILHVGRLRLMEGGTEDFKKQLIMIEVFKKMIKNGFSDWKLVLGISVNDKEEDYLKSMQKSAVGFPVEFLVNKNNDLLWKEYSRARIYWHASGFGENLEKYPQFAEHFGISTVEAMGAGAVPVVINAGGQKEIITDGENGYLWTSVDELISKTLNLAKDTVLLDKLSKNATESARKFSKDNFYKGIDKLITA
jgi:glycosyltransferase involved in cell wall biosynthesis